MTDFDFDLPETNFSSAFNMTRASHVVLHVPDLEACRKFYTEVIGLIVTAEENGTLYLRGVEEICHHSLVLKAGEPALERLGYRVFTDEDVFNAKSFFERQGRACKLVEVDHQGPTLQFRDDAGFPLEICATMDRQKRMYTATHLHRGAAAQRMDHWQTRCPDPTALAGFYTELGFRISDYIVLEGEREAFGYFLHRKGNQWDNVLIKSDPIDFHHFGYVVQSMSDVLKACDVAGSLGWGSLVEDGIGRHGDPHCYYLYMRDPAGHRVELLLAGIQMIDIDEEPNLYLLNADNERFWGRPLSEASEQGTKVL